MQMQSLNDGYANAQREALGSNLESGGPVFREGPQQNNLPNTDYGRSSLKDLAERLAMGYGLRFGRGSLVDAQGQFMQTPNQLAGLQGGGGADPMSLSDVAASMNLVSQQVNDRRIEMQQNKADAAIKAATGLIGQRGRGSLAELQANFYQQMAANYTNPNLLPEQQDFSFWIQKEQLDQAIAERSQEKEADAGGGGDGGGGSGGGGGDFTATPTPDNGPYHPYRNPTSTTYPRSGGGDVATSGPHAGQRPVYTYDPITKTTSVTWE
jgi:hypothetical protein